MLFDVKYKMTTKSGLTGLVTTQNHQAYVESDNLQTLKLDFFSELLKTYAKNGFNIYNISYQHCDSYEYFSFSFELYGSHAMAEVSDIITTVK